MKKVAIAVMLLATSAFGVVTLSITDGVVVDGKVTVTMSANVPDGEVLNNFSIYSNYEDPGMQWLTWTGRTTAPSNVGILDFWQHQPEGQNLGAYEVYVDFGVIPSRGLNYKGPGTFPLCDLTFDVAPDAEFPLIVELWAGSYSGGSASGAELPNVTFTITPEPASMLLLAAGAAFFARRRRA